MNKKTPFILLALPLAFFGNSDLSAAVLADYTFSGSNDNVSSVHDDVSATALSIGQSGTEFGTVGESSFGNGWSIQGPANGPGAAASVPTRFIRTGNVTTSEAGAVNANDYFEFTITPDSGFATSLTSIEMDIAATAADGGSNTVNWFVRTGIDSFGTTVDSVFSVSKIGSGTSAYSHVSASFTGIAFQNLTEATTFRLYTFSNTTGTATTYVNRIDNIRLNGDVVVAPIPEPARYSLILGCLGALPLLRRKRRVPKASTALANA